MPRSAMPSVAVMVLVCGVVLFGSAGRLDIIEFWCWLVELAAISVATLLLIEPDLVRERMRPGGRRPSLGYWVSTLLFFVTLAVAGLDRGRLHWSDSVPAWLHAVALLLFVLGWVPVIWAMRVNRFFSSAVTHPVRTRTARDHRRAIPVRAASRLHSGLSCLSGQRRRAGLLVAAAIGWMSVPILLWRTVKEDRMLHAELPGYAEYAARVTSRLLPGVW